MDLKGFPMPYKGFNAALTAAVNAVEGIALTTVLTC